MGFLPSVVLVHGFFVLADSDIGLGLAGSVDPLCQEQMSPCFEDVLLLPTRVICCYGIFGIGIIMGTKHIRNDGTFETLYSFAVVAFPPQETRMLNCGRLIA